MRTGNAVYEQAQELLKLAHQCVDTLVAAKMREIAHELLEIAYRDDEVVEVENGRAQC